jgi:hypothetical protein
MFTFSFYGCNPKVKVNLIELRNEHSVKSIIKLDNNDILISGSFYSNNKGIELFLMKLNKEGELQWERTYGGSLNDYGSILIRIDNNNTLLLGETTSKDEEFTSNNGGRDLYLISIDSVGHIKSSMCLGGSNDESLESVCESSDNDVIVMGWTFSSDKYFSDTLNLSYRSFIRKIKLSGEVVWNKYYVEDSIPNNRPYIPNSIKKTPKGGFVYSMLNKYGPPIYTDSHIIEIDKDGNINWENEFESYTIQKIDNTKDSGYVLVGNKGIPNSLDSRIVLSKLNNKGELEWEHIIGKYEYLSSYGNELLQKVKDVIVTMEGEIVVVGETYSNIEGSNELDFRGGTDLFIFKYNSKGNIRWKKTFGGSGSDKYLQFVNSSNGGYKLIGTTNSHDGLFSSLKDLFSSQYNNQKNIFIMNLDKNGNHIN